MEDFKILTVEEEKNLTKEELINYYKELKQYYRGQKIPFQKIRKAIHPFVLFAMKNTNKYKLQQINEMPKLTGPAIFAVNHSNCHDAPSASEVIKSHHYVLVGKQRLNFIDRLAFKLNGVIYVDRKDKNDKSAAKTEMIKHLSQNDNILMFPEGTWNLTENQIMLPLNWGIIDIAKYTNAPIVPIILEYKNDICYANCGKPITIEPDVDKKQAITDLTDIMATLRWEIWEQFPIEKRQNVSLENFVNKVEEVINEYPKLDIEYEKTVIRKNHDTLEDVFEPIRKL